MTDPVRPDDRELEQYLKGDSPLSRRYRAASTETPPPELDAAILAEARSAVRRRPLGAQRWLASVALAASVILGVNLGWNVYKAAPPPGEAAQEKSVSEDRSPAPQAIAPAAPPPAALEALPEQKAPPAERDLAGAGGARDEARAAAAQAESERVADASRLKAEARERQARASEEQSSAPAEQPLLQKQAAAPMRRDTLASGAAASADVPAAVAAPAAPTPWTEAEKIDRLIQFVAGLDDVDFIRNGKEHSAEDAAKHMRLKLEKSGKRCQTADDFIRICASFSSISGEAYLMRFPDGRTRTAEDVLREQLATMP